MGVGDGRESARFERANELGDRSLALCERWLALCEGTGELELVRLVDGESLRVRIQDGEPGDAWSFGFAPEGDELWAIDDTRQTLHRYRLPD